jgi:hypothetical protein
VFALGVGMSMHTGREGAVSLGSHDSDFAIGCIFQ